MKRLIRPVMLAVAVLLTGTTAFGVALSTAGPRVHPISAIVTDRSVREIAPDSPPAPAPAVAVQASPASTVTGATKATAKEAPIGKPRRGVVPAPRTAVSDAKPVRPAPQPSMRPTPARQPDRQADTAAGTVREPDHEVVTPEVRDDAAEDDRGENSEDDDRQKREDPTEGD